MHQLKIEADKPVEVVYGEKKFVVSRPKIGYLKEFKRRIRDAGKPEASEDVIDIMMEYCKQVGVPNDVLDSWTEYELEQFFNHFSSGEKKS